MTFGSLRSGGASSGRVTIAHHPAMQAMAIVANTASLCSTEKSMIRLIIETSAPRDGRPGWIALGRLFALELLFALLGTEVVGRGAIRESIAGSYRAGWIHRHAAIRIHRHFRRRHPFGNPGRPILDLRGRRP